MASTSLPHPSTVQDLQELARRARLLASRRPHARAKLLAIAETLDDLALEGSPDTTGEPKQPLFQSFRFPG